MSGLRRLGRRLWHGWLAIAGHFGEVQTLVVLGIVYSFVMGPVAVTTQLARRDFLEKRHIGEPGSAWRDAEAHETDLERVKQQF